MIRGKLPFFSRWPLTIASMMLGWSDPKLTKTWVIPASQRASKKANDVVYMPGREADKWSCLTGEATGVDGTVKVVECESEENGLNSWWRCGNEWKDFVGCFLVAVPATVVVAVGALLPAVHMLGRSRDGRPAVTAS